MILSNNLSCFGKILVLFMIIFLFLRKYLSFNSKIV